MFNESDKDSDWKSFSFKCLSYLIALDRLEIKVFNTDRLVHFKTGYAKDKDGNVVAFTGSVNYTLSALLLNYEQIMTFCSWKDQGDSERISEIVDPINDLLKEKTPIIPMVSGADVAQYIREKYPVNNVEILGVSFASQRSGYSRFRYRSIPPLRYGSRSIAASPLLSLTQKLSAK